MSVKSEKACDTCLFYVDAMPHIVICVGHKRIKEYSSMRSDCKFWLENTPENAKRELTKIHENEQKERK